MTLDNTNLDKTFFHDSTMEVCDRDHTPSQGLTPPFKASTLTQSVTLLGQIWSCGCHQLQFPGVYCAFWVPEGVMFPAES